MKVSINAGINGEHESCSRRDKPGKAFELTLRAAEDKRSGCQQKLLSFAARGFPCKGLC